MMYLDVGVEKGNDGEAQIFIRKSKGSPSRDGTIIRRNRDFSLNDMQELFPDVIFNVVESQNLKAGTVRYDAEGLLLSSSDITYQGMNKTLFRLDEKFRICDAVSNLIDQYIEEKPHE